MLYRIITDIKMSTLRCYRNYKFGILYNWNTVIVCTPGDGNCLLHAICNAIYEPYRTGIYKGEKINRTDVVKQLRNDLADKLSSEYKGTTHYEYLLGGNLSKVAEFIPEYRIEYMINELKSNRYLCYGYIEYISNILSHDIYIIDGNHDDQIYVSDENEYAIKGNRPSIIIYWKNEHYELVGIKCDGHISTRFSCKHSAILELQKHVKHINGDSH